jgi:hypothetical protein
MIDLNYTLVGKAIDSRINEVYFKVRQGILEKSRKAKTLEKKNTSENNNEDKTHT